MCDLIDDPGGGVAGFSDHGMYDIRTLNVTRGHVQNVCNTRAYIYALVLITSLPQFTYVSCKKATCVSFTS